MRASEKWYRKRAPGEGHRRPREVENRYGTTAIASKPHVIYYFIIIWQFEDHIQVLYLYHQAGILTDYIVAMTRTRVDMVAVLTLLMFVWSDHLHIYLVITFINVMISIQSAMLTIPINIMCSCRVVGGEATTCINGHLYCREYFC